VTMVEVTMVEVTMVEVTMYVLTMHYSAPFSVLRVATPCGYSMLTIDYGILVESAELELCQCACLIDNYMCRLFSRINKL
jgi:hypothetical protein